MEARAALREAAAAATEAADRARTLADQLDEVLAALSSEASATQSVCSPNGLPRHLSDPLSPREREVLALVAEGRSNKEIAAALFVSPNTIKTHVASLLHKLSASSRTQLATIAARHHPHGGVGAEFMAI